MPEKLNPEWAHGLRPPEFLTWAEWLSYYSSAVADDLSDVAESTMPYFEVEERTLEFLTEDELLDAGRIRDGAGLRTIARFEIEKHARNVVKAIFETKLMLDKVDWRTGAEQVANRAKERLLRRGFTVTDDSLLP